MTLLHDAPSWVLLHYQEGGSIRNYEVSYPQQSTTADRGVETIDIISVIQVSGEIRRAYPSIF